MRPYLIRRILGALLAVWAIASIVFFVLRVTADPVALLLPAEATREDAARLRERLGLNKPLTTQYAEFIGGLVTGDLGQSYRYGDPALKMIAQRLPYTVLLVVMAMALSLLVAIPLGILAAVYRNTLIDYLASVLSFIGFATPNFWLGIMLIILFSLQLKWLPTSGVGSWKHLVLPTVTLATWPLGQFTRLIRSEMLEVLGEDYIRTARAKGASRRRVVWRHAFKNASLSLITLAGMTFGALLGGAIVTETIFAWPGMGRLVLQSVGDRDFPIIQATVVYMAAVYVIINLVVDLLYTIVDPRIRMS